MNQIAKRDYSKWVDEYGDALFSYAMLRVRGRELAEDLVQETFLAALRGIENFKGESSLKTWLIGILRRKIVDHYRRSAKFVGPDSEELNEELRPVDHFHNEGDAAGHWIAGEGPADWSELPGTELEQSELQRMIGLCIAALPGRLAALFTRKEVDEADSEEICKEFEISTSNLWVMLHRARARLRQCLERYMTGKM